MSHFTVLVIGENPEQQLAPFDENESVPEYVRYTKEQLIERGKQEIANYNTNVYQKYLADKEAYAADCRNPDHLTYLETEFPAKLGWTEEEIYQDAIKHCEPEELNAEGGILSTYNPLSKWDWYQLGGRWTGFFKMKEGCVGTIGEKSWASEQPPVNTADQALKRDIDFAGSLNNGRTFAVLKDGQWYERGEMGWWGIVIDGKEDEQWEQEFDKLLSELPEDTLLSVYDCHI
jgi:hypothetical protein